MLRFLVLCLAIVFAAPAASGQPFPPPGEGIFTWERVTDRPLRAYALAFGPGGLLYAARDTLQLYEPAPAGPPAGRWRRLGYPRLGVNAILPLDAAGDTLIVSRGGGGIMTRSTDGGATWTDVNGCSSCGSHAPRDPDGFLVLPAGHARAGRLLAGSRLIFSDDRGASWTDAAGGDVGARDFALVPSGRVLAASVLGVAASDDGGASYATAVPLGSEVYAVAAAATPGSVQAGAPACGLPDPAQCEGALAIAIDTSLPHLRLYATNDGGQTWGPSLPLPEPYDGVGAIYVAGLFSAGVEPETGLGRAFAVLGRGTVYATRDGGQSWAAVGRLPLDVSTGEHYVRHALLGPDGHLWVTTMRIGGSSNDAFVFRSAESVSEAYPVAGAAAAPERVAPRLVVRPNPASGAVSVVVTAPEAGRAVVSVYDAAGRQVAMLHDGPLAAGETAFGLDTSGLPAGVYRATVAGLDAPLAVSFTVVR